jgi:PleD family two-component response regulator
MIKNFPLLKNKSVLFADDDTITNMHMVETLAMMFDKVHSAYDGEEAYKLYEDVSPDLIITD